MSSGERRLILSKDVCRLSTISPNGWPHSVTVGYVFIQGRFYIPSHRRAKKISNLRKNGAATIVIDDEETERGLMIECTSRILDGDKAQRWREAMRRAKGWQNDVTTAVISLEPLRRASWSRRLKRVAKKQ